MKLDVVAAGRAAKLELSGSRFKFAFDAGSEIESDFSIAESAPGIYSVLVEGRAYEAFAGSNSEIWINGRSVAVEIFDPRELNARRRGKSREGRQAVSAPMPGKVIRILATVGDHVELGQGLIVVEAMKMQNEMKSPKAGRVVEILSKVDAAVAAGEVLVVIE